MLVAQKLYRLCFGSNVGELAGAFRWCGGQGEGGIGLSAVSLLCLITAGCDQFGEGASEVEADLA